MSSKHLQERIRELENENAELRDRVSELLQHVSWMGTGASGISHAFVERGKMAEKRLKSASQIVMDEFFAEFEELKTIQEDIDKRTNELAEWDRLELTPAHATADFVQYLINVIEYSHSLKDYRTNQAKLIMRDIEVKPLDEWIEDYLQRIKSMAILIGINRSVQSILNVAFANWTGTSTIAWAICNHLYKTGEVNTRLLEFLSDEQIEAVFGSKMGRDTIAQRLSLAYKLENEYEGNVTTTAYKEGQHRNMVNRARECLNDLERASCMIYKDLADRLMDIASEAEA